MEEKKLWCEECGSKGVRHKNGCPKIAQLEETPTVVEPEYKTEYEVINPIGFSTVRVYSESVHGENAKELAKMFAKKNNYIVL